MDYSSPDLRSTYDVPAYRCDSRGFLAPESAERRFQEAYGRNCPSFFDPEEALALAKPRRPSRQPPAEFVEAALAPLWVRRKFSCRDPVAFDKFESEKYPLPADVVRDSRPPLLQVGSQSRFDGRPPVDVYRKLGHEQNFDPLPSYPGHY